jgi:hypothetical protein
VLAVPLDGVTPHNSSLLGRTGSDCLEHNLLSGRLEGKSKIEKPGDGRDVTVTYANDSSTR